MTARLRPLEALLGALAVVIASWPLTGLFQSGSWVRPAILIIVVQLLVGLAARALRLPVWVGVPLQVISVAILALALFSPDSLSPAHWGQLPMAVNDLLYQARVTLTRYSAPAPVNDGVSFMLVLVLGAAAVIVDLATSWLRSPAVAGLPLLAVFLFSTSNTGDSLNPIYFVTLAVAWLLMLARQHQTALSGWSSTQAYSRTPERLDDRLGLGAYYGRARVLGVAVIVLALLLPAFIPHLPTRYLADGLAEGPSSNGASVGFTDSLDLSQDLNNEDRTPVLRYATTDSSPVPLKALTMSMYSNGRWERDAPRDARTGRNGAQLPAPNGLTRAAQGRLERINVAGNTMQAPYLATPWPVAEADLGDTNWTYEGQGGLLRVGGRPSSYSVTYRTLRPEARPTSNDIDTDAVPAWTTEVDTASMGPVTRATTQALSAGSLDDGASPFEKAVAIQDWLRDPSLFTYSLTLSPTQRGANGQPLDAISNFLATRRGYCTQFSTAMVMMARSVNIPARVAVGFLPGTAVADNYEVRAADAHAWPELWFPGLGWTRFEPTPGIRSGEVPQYTAANSTASPTQNPNQEPTDSDETSAATTTVAPSTTAAAEPTTAPTGTGQGRDWGAIARTAGIILLVVVLGVLGALVLPLAARRRREQPVRASENATERIEAEWTAMTSRLDDLGVRPGEGLSPRQLEAHYRRYAPLERDGREALRRAAVGLEHSRYGGASTDTIEPDVEVVVRQARELSPWPTRVIARVFPRTGRRALAAAWGRLTRLGRRRPDDSTD